MKIPKWGVVVAVLFVLLATSFGVMPVAASPYEFPCSFYGTATVDGVPVVAGTEISAWFGGLEVASTVTGDPLPPNMYSLVVELDPIYEGEEISFMIGTLWANETGIWEAWGSVEVNLTATTPNNPPYVPGSPSPADGATGVSIDADLSWTGGDPDAGDTVTYDVYFGTDTTPPLVSNDQAATTYDPGTLSYDTHYYWKIVATDNHGASTGGPLWDFTTIDLIPPTVIRTSPRDGATSVALDAVVRAIFSEDIQEGTNFGDIGISEVTGVSASIDGDTLTVAHDDFAYNTTYEVTIPAGAVEDLANNPLAEAYTWSFTTMREPPPEEEEERIRLPKPEAGPHVSVGNLRISPAEVSLNQPVTISISVYNSGDKGGSKTLNLLINGELEQSIRVGIPAHGNKSFSFTVQRASPGVYSVYIAGASGWFTVSGLEVSSAPEEVGLSTGDLIAIVVIAIVLIAGIVFAFVYLRRSA